MAGKFLDKSARDAKVLVHGLDVLFSASLGSKRVISRVAAFAMYAFAALAVVGAIAGYSREAQAAGAFKLKSTTTSEVSGAWHIFVTIELPRAPATAHVPLKFLFTKETVYERALVDGHTEPVINRTPLQNQTPSIESLDVDFADGSGKIFKGTRFDFGLTRQRGYEAGEYKVQVRTSDGTDVGATQHITLTGDNPVVDRRSITFNAKEKSIKKVDDGTDGGAKVAKNDADDTAPAQNQDVAASGTAAPFIPADAYQKQPEEEVKEHPAGCGCETIGHRTASGTRTGTGALAFGVMGLAAAFTRLAFRKRARASRVSRT